MNRVPIVVVGGIVVLVTGLVCGVLLRPVLWPQQRTPDPSVRVLAIINQMTKDSAAPPALREDRLRRVLVRETIMQMMLTDPQLVKKAAGPKVVAAMEGLLQDRQRLNSLKTALANDPDALQQMADEILVRQSLENDEVAEQSQQTFIEMATPQQVQPRK